MAIWVHDIANERWWFHLIWVKLSSVELGELKATMTIGMMTSERRRSIFFWTCPFVIFIFLTIELPKFDVTFETASIVYAIKPCAILSIHISSRWIDHKNGILIYRIRIPENVENEYLCNISNWTWKLSRGKWNDRNQRTKKQKIVHLRLCFVTLNAAVIAFSRPCLVISRMVRCFVRKPWYGQCCPNVNATMETKIAKPKYCLQVMLIKWTIKYNCMNRIQFTDLFRIFFLYCICDLENKKKTQICFLRDYFDWNECCTLIRWIILVGRAIHEKWIAFCWSVCISTVHCLPFIKRVTTNATY